LESRSKKEATTEAKQTDHARCVRPSHPCCAGSRAARHLSVNSETREEEGATFARWQELAQESLGLVSAIRAVYNGEQVQLLDNRQKADKDQCNDGLTSREMETLVLVARGMVAKEVARVLAISEKTVRNHIGNIYRKLHIYDRSQVVIYAMKKGLIDLDEV